MAAHSSIRAWEIPWTEEPGRLQSMGSQSWTRLKGRDQRCLWLIRVETVEVTWDRSWDLAACSEGCTPTPSKAVLPNNTSIRSPLGKCDGLKRRVCGCFVFGDGTQQPVSILSKSDFVRC